MPINPIPTKGKTLAVAHFPTEFQTVIFRLWECVPVQKLAKVLHTTEENVAKAASDMGLPNQAHLEKWHDRGYISIIRSAWNLLPYEQILELLDYTEERLSFILKEDDFLDVKLGEKCDCKPVYYRELTEAEKTRTSEIKAAMDKYVVPIIKNGYEEPFNFFNRDRYEPICQGRGGEVKVDSSWALEYPLGSELLCEIIEDFKAFLLKYNIELCDTNGGRCKCGGKGKILMTLDAKTDDEEYHEVTVTDNLIKINAATPVGILRGIYELENRAELAGEFSFDKFEI